MIPSMIAPSTVGSSRSAGRGGTTTRPTAPRPPETRQVAGRCFLTPGRQIDFDREGCRGLDRAGEDIAFAVVPARRVEEIGVDNGDVGGGQLHSPVEPDARAGVLIQFDDPVGGLRARRDDLCDESKSVSAFQPGPAAASSALARSRARRLRRLDALGLTTTIASTISIPAHCSSVQESYSATVICLCIHSGATISILMTTGIPATALGLRRAENADHHRGRRVEGTVPSPG